MKLRRIKFALWIVLGFVGMASFAFADEYPPIRPGLWHFHRTLESSANSGKPQIIDLKKCTDPVADMKVMNQKLTQIGCKFSPAVQNANVYHFTATCTLPNAKKGTSTTDLTYEGEDSYSAKIVSDGALAGVSGITREELIAKRLGNCQ